MGQQVEYTLFIPQSQSLRSHHLPPSVLSPPPLLLPPGSSLAPKLCRAVRVGGWHWGVCRLEINSNQTQNHSIFSPSALRPAFSPGITHLLGEKSSEASQSQRGTCKVGRIKHFFFFFPPGWFLLYYLLSLCLSLWQDFQEIDLI